MNEGCTGYQEDIVLYEREPLQDHCGILAAYSLGGDVPFFHSVVAGLKTLQTRGYDGAGLCALSTDGQVFIQKGEGMISDIFTPDVLRGEVERKAKLWVAQTRYGTKGGFIAENVQPFHVNDHSGEYFFLAHNGQFSTSPDAPPSEYSDTFLFAKELEQSMGATWDDRILDTIGKKNGAYSVIIGTKNALYLIRDPRGIRPLVYGKIKGPNGDSIIVAASETEALIRMGATSFSEVMPGTILKFSNNSQDKVTVSLPSAGLPSAGCIFETVYLDDGRSIIFRPRTHPDEINNDPTVFAARQKSGEILAREELLTRKKLLEEGAPLSRFEVDIAIGVPGTGIPGGEAYARVMGIPYNQAITDKAKQEDQRTFMSADTDAILEKVMNHFDFDAEALFGKKVVLIDDSIVRGNVTLGLVRLLKEKYGVKEVHIRVLSPPIDKTCHLGINTRKKNDLIAARHGGDIEGIRQELGADSLMYISGKGLLEAFTGDPHAKGFCMGCMAEHDYPLDGFGNEANTDSPLEKD